MSNHDFVTLTGLDDALIGKAIVGGRYVAVYSYDLLVKTVHKQNKCSLQDAFEHVDVNVLGVCQGDLAPIVVYDV